MYRAALTQDLRYLHESLKKQRFTGPVDEGEDPPKNPSAKEQAFFGRLRELPRLRSFEEHIGGISGLPLDAVQLLFRSELPADELHGQTRVAAAIIKTQHDLHFWEPLEALGLAQSFHLHRHALQSDVALLKANCPPQDRVSLRAAWNRASVRLEKALLAGV